MMVVVILSFKHSTNRLLWFCKRLLDVCIMSFKILYTSMITRLYFEQVIYDMSVISALLAWIKCRKLLSHILALLEARLSLKVHGY